MSQEAAINRRSLMRGFWREERKVVRPPWAAAPSVFTDLCDRCGKCIKVCHAQIIIKGESGFPEVDFQRGACDFCGDCLRKCPTSALNKDEETPWGLKAQVEGACLSFCRVCEDHCPTRAIKMRPQLGGKLLPIIAEEKCNGCGACVAPCPARIIGLVNKGEKLAQHT